MNKRQFIDEFVWAVEEKKTESNKEIKQVPSFVLNFNLFIIFGDGAIHSTILYLIVARR